MPTIRDELIPIVDELRREVVDEIAGLRLDDVVIRRRSWPSGRKGIGTPVDADVALDPRPKVNPPRPHVRLAEPGRFEEGDLLVSRISRSYTEAELSGGLSGGQELFWLVSGEAYQVVAVEDRYLEWRVHLRRMRNRS